MYEVFLWIVRGSSPWKTTHSHSSSLLCLIFSEGNCSEHAQLGVTPSSTCNVYVPIIRMVYIQLNVRNLKTACLNTREIIANFPCARISTFTLHVLLKPVGSQAAVLSQCFFFFFSFLFFFFFFFYRGMGMRPGGPLRYNGVHMWEHRFLLYHMAHINRAGKKLILIQMYP